MADGAILPSMGEKRFLAVPEEGHKRRMVAQMCGVDKSWLSVRRVVENGGMVVFKKGVWLDRGR